MVNGLALIDKRRSDVNALRLAGSLPRGPSDAGSIDGQYLPMSEATEVSSKSNPTCTLMNPDLTISN